MHTKINSRKLVHKQTEPRQSYSLASLQDILLEYRCPVLCFFILLKSKNLANGFHLGYHVGVILGKVVDGADDFECFFHATALG